MKLYKRVIAFLLATTSIATMLCGCSSKKAQTKLESKEDFRVTAYVTKDSVLNYDSFKKEYINDVTDVILFGVATFDESGNVILDENMDICYNNIRKLVDSVSGVRLHINLLGPSAQSDIKDWNDKMDDLAAKHSVAFNSGNLIPNIQDFLKKYDFDGVYFDYEYPLKNKYWKDYNKFIVDLNQALGDAYKIGMALSSWNIGHQSQAAMDATDYVEIMSYDIFDDDGNHASFDTAKSCIEKFVKKGYDLYKLDLGLPFYGRPVDKDEYWYDYATYYKELASDGSYDDPVTGKKFYFNTYEMIKQKTSYAIDYGLGGVMIWNWNCDVAYGEEKSLFKAISEVKNVAKMQATEE